MVRIGRNEKKIMVWGEANKVNREGTKRRRIRMREMLMVGSKEEEKEIGKGKEVGTKGGVPVICFPKLID